MAARLLAVCPWNKFALIAAEENQGGRISSCARAGARRCRLRHLFAGSW
jgi:hypothetical protein